MPEPLDSGVPFPDRGFFDAKGHPCLTCMDRLIAIGLGVTIEFATIAAANNYWR